MKPTRRYHPKNACNKCVYCAVYLLVFGWHAAQAQPTATTPEVAQNVSNSLRYSKKNIDSALYFAKIASSVATQTGKPTDLADALYAQTVANYAAARYVKALEYATNGLEISAKYDFVNNSPLFLNEVGLIYSALHDNFLALKYHTKALQLAEKINNAPLKAQLYNNIGLIKLRINIQEGVVYLNKSLKIYKDTDDQEGQANTYTNLGIAYLYQDSVAMASNYFEKSLPIYEKYQNYWGQSTCYQNLAKIYTAKNQPTIAYENYKKASEVALLLASKDLEARSLNGMSKNTKNAIEAENLANQALKIGNTLHSASILKDANENLAQIHKNNKRYDLAYYHQTQSTNLATQIYNAENSLKLIELTLEKQANQQRTEYQQLKKDSDEYDKQSALTNIWLAWVGLSLVIGCIIGYYLFHQIRRLKQQQSDLQLKTDNFETNTQYLKNINTTKNDLFYHLSSSLKNPLASTQSILGLYNNQTIAEKELRDCTKYLRIQVKKTIVFLDSLLFWTRQTINQNNSATNEQINIYETFNEVQEFLQPILDNKRTTVINKIPTALMVNMAQGTMNIIARNLLFNCMEYGNGNRKVIISQKISASSPDALIIRMTCGMTEIFIKKIQNATLSPEDSLNSHEISYVVACILLEKNGGGIKVTHLDNDMVEIDFSLPTASIIQKNIA